MGIPSPQQGHSAVQRETLTLPSGRPSSACHPSATAALRHTLASSAVHAIIHPSLLPPVFSHPANHLFPGWLKAHLLEESHSRPFLPQAAPWLPPAGHQPQLACRLLPCLRACSPSRSANPRDPCPPHWATQGTPRAPQHAAKQASCCMQGPPDNRARLPESYRSLTSSPRSCLLNKSHQQGVSPFSWRPQPAPAAASGLTSSERSFILHIRDINRHLKAY